MDTGENYEEPNIGGDRLNFILLTTLYILQGAVGGIVSAIPNVLQKRNVGYENQLLIRRGPRFLIKVCGVCLNEESPSMLREIGGLTGVRPLCWVKLVCKRFKDPRLRPLQAARKHIVARRNVPIKLRAGFDVVWYPLSLKILVAPIVDSLHWKRVGRRKSWLAATQYFTGTLLLFLSFRIDDLLGSEDGKQKPNMRLLTLVFFLCNLSNSVQDVAVDAWSLTIFEKRNVAYSAVCQSIGLTTGYVLISASFIILESKDFRNMFASVPQDRGFVTFSEFMYFWSLMFFVTTTLILLMKKENENRGLLKVKDKRDLRITRTYKLIWDILQIRPVQILCLFLLTRHIGTGPIHNVASLKLLDHGITRDKLALLALPLFPIQILSPLVLNRYVTGRRPMRVFFLFYILKLANGILYALFVYIISFRKENNSALPTWYYWPMVFIHNFDNFAFFVTMMAVVAALARISDPRFGGVYMTLFNSINNFGNSWPSTVCLRVVNLLTIKSCGTGNAEAPARCVVIDGLYVEIALCSIIGALWIFLVKKLICNNLEKTDAAAFTVKRMPATVRNFVPDKQSIPLIIVTECRSENQCDDPPENDRIVGSDEVT